MSSRSLKLAGVTAVAAASLLVSGCGGQNQAGSAGGAVPVLAASAAR